LSSQAPTVSKSKEPLAPGVPAAFELVLADAPVLLAEAETDEPLELELDGEDAVDEPPSQVTNGHGEVVSRDRSE